MAERVKRRTRDVESRVFFPSFFSFSANSPPLSLADAEGGEDDDEDASDIDLADPVADG